MYKGKKQMITIPVMLYVNYFDGVQILPQLRRMTLTGNQFLRFAAKFLTRQCHSF